MKQVIFGSTPMWYFSVIEAYNYQQTKRMCLKVLLGRLGLR
jgi:hypothetical protein